MAPRIPYVDNDVPGEVADAVRRRRGAQLLELDRLLLHNQDLTRGWNDFMGGIRARTALDGAVRELCICWVAVLNGAEYEWGQHAPEALREGVSQDCLDALARRDLSKLTREQRVAIDYATAMTEHVDVPDDVFAAVRSSFDEKQVVELTLTIASYNMVSRFLVALHVGR